MTQQRQKRLVHGAERLAVECLKRVEEDLVAKGIIDTDDEHANALEIIRDRIDAHRDRLLGLMGSDD